MTFDIYNITHLYPQSYYQIWLSYLNYSHFLKLNFF